MNASATAGSPFYRWLRPPPQVVFPVCKGEADFRVRLLRKLNVATAESHNCPVCMDPFAAADGVCCAKSHFICNGCLDDNVLSICDRSPAELAAQPHLVPCTHLGCSEGHAERELVCRSVPRRPSRQGPVCCHLTFYRRRHTRTQG